MDKYQETFKTWNSVAELYQDKFMDLSIYNDSYDFLLKQIRKADSNLLDIGCGPGNISKYLLNANPKLKVWGIDISENMVSLAKKNVPSGQFQVLDARELSQLQGKFDVLIAGFCLPYLSKSDVLKFISNCKSKLNTGGLLYLSFVSGQVESEGFLEGNPNGRLYFYYHHENSINRILNDLKFRNIYSETIHYTKSDGTTENHLIIITKVSS